MSLPVLLFSQTLSVSYKKQDAASILNEIKNPNLKFNFNHASLPNGSYTFSFEGERAQLIDLLSTLFQRKIIQLDESTFTIQNMPPEEQYLISKPSYKGIVVNENNDPLPFCGIYIKNLDLYFETNEDGQFDFSSFLSNTEKVQFQYLGYYNKSVLAGELKSLDARIIMTEQKHILGEIIVRDYFKINNENELSNAANINVEHINMAGSSDADLMGMSQLLPGIYSSGTMNDLQVRGGPPDQTSYKWNGIQTFQNSLFYGRISAYNPFMTDDITVVKNGMASTESGQVSGSINMNSSFGKMDTFQVRLFSDLFYSNIGINLPLFKNKVQISLINGNLIMILLQQHNHC
ncbi:MAG: carboxypeptidase-like regulatory domain-containing protein [Bacteroidota bacterium]